MLCTKKNPIRKQVSYTLIFPERNLSHLKYQLCSCRLGSSYILHRLNFGCCEKVESRDHVQNSCVNHERNLQKTIEFTQDSSISISNSSFSLSFSLSAFRTRWGFVDLSVDPKAFTLRDRQTPIVLRDK